MEPADGSKNTLGWIYFFDGGKFIKELGREAMARLARDEHATMGIVSFDGRAQLQSYVDQGRVIIHGQSAFSFKGRAFP